MPPLPTFTHPSVLLASLSRTPKPRAVVECGPYSNPDYGCTDERQDALAAYTQALAWYITEDTREEIVGYRQGQTAFVDGLTQETCRDFVHTGYGLSAISHFAETTRIQGQDVYPEVADRLRHAGTNVLFVAWEALTHAGG